jgi:hypothetical protein
MLAVTLLGSRAVAVTRRRWIAVLLLFASPGLTPREAHGQAAPTARVLRRVAEAVDGHRSGKNVWVVVGQLDTAGVIGVYEIRDTALAALRANQSRRPLLLGPYATLTDGSATSRAFLIGCVHDPRSAMGPPRQYCPGQVLPLADIDSLTLTIHKRDGTTLALPVPLSVDAMFFSLSSIDKFVLPYYTQVLGAEQSALIRRRIVSGIH